MPFKDDVCLVRFSSVVPTVINKFDVLVSNVPTCKWMDFHPYISTSMPLGSGPLKLGSMSKKNSKTLSVLSMSDALLRDLLVINIYNDKVRAN